MKNFFKLLEFWKWYPFIILFFLVIYILNFPLSYFVWWDALPDFLNPSFYYSTYVWNDWSLLWWVANKIVYLSYIPYMYVLELFVNIFWSLYGQYLYNLLFLLFGVLMLYYWIEYYFNNKKYAILLTLFFVLNFIWWWVIVHRWLIFISLAFFSAPLVARLLISSVNNYKYYYYLFIYWILLLPIATNPWYFFSWILFWLFYIIYFVSFIDKSLNWLKKIVIWIFIFLIPFITSFFSYAIFMKYNNALVNDTWNTEILIKKNLEIEKETNNLSQSLRGYTSTLNWYWWYNPNNLNSEELYFSFPWYQIYNSVFFSFASWIPLFIILFWCIFLRKSSEKNIYIYWVFVFLISIFIFKSSAAPFWWLYTRLIENISAFGIFRGPHLKFSTLFLTTILFIFISLFLLLEKSNSKIKLRVVSISIIFYTVLFWYYWFLWKAIPEIKLVKNIPIEYQNAANYIKESNIEKIIISPFNFSTWTNTEFGYEWYSIFSLLLPETWIWNRNDGAFYTYSSEIEKSIWSSLSKNEWKLLDQLVKFNIDTVIYDWYTDRYPRWRINETHEENLKFLLNSWLKKEIEFWKISIWRVPNKLLTKNLYSLSWSLSNYIKVSPVRYDLDFTNLTNDNLVFLQSFHNEWKIYPRLNDWNSFFKNLAFSDIKYLFYPSLQLNHINSNLYGNKWYLSSNLIKNIDKKYYSINKDGSVNLRLTLYFVPQLYFYIGIIISVFISLFSFIALVIYALLRKKK